MFRLTTAALMNTMHQSDELMKNTLACLADDFEPYVTTVVADRFRDWVKAQDLRTVTVPACNAVPGYIFKRVYQLQNFCKRYIFASDAMSQQELDKAGLAQFKEQQAAMHTPSVFTDRMVMVLKEARMVMNDILGSYDRDHHYTLCKFGPKSAHGVPFSKAYLDCKVKVLSGTHAQQYWFTDLLAGDFPLRHAVLANKLREMMSATDSVKVTAVPKAFNKSRMMAPDTVTGGFISLGLGRYLREQLESNTHINLKTAQKIHRRLAEKSSLSGYHATGDLSRASDSFMHWHLALLLPPDWREAIMLCSMPKADVDGEVIPLNSRMLMGTGFTFPLQTLLFYAILQAIVRLLKKSCKVYVFGDDLIYPSSIHRYVRPVLEELGFIMNDEKTFPSGPFRESCGGDYFRGVDVRPTMPKGISQRLTNRAYEAMCYSLINQLLRRWELAEIPNAIAYLLTQAARVSSTGKLCAVPPDAPDYSGVRVDYMHVPVPKRLFHAPRWTKRQISLTRVIATQPIYRLVESVPIYYWDALRVGSTEEPVMISSASNPGIMQNAGVWSIALKELIHDTQMLRPFLEESRESVIHLKPGDLVEVQGKIRRLRKKDKWLGMLAVVKKGTQRYRYAEAKVSTWKGI